MISEVAVWDAKMTLGALSRHLDSGSQRLIHRPSSIHVTVFMSLFEFSV